MIAQKITRAIARVHEMGIGTATTLIHHRIKKARFARSWRQRWQNGFTFHSLPEKIVVHPAWYKLIQEQMTKSHNTGITILGFGTYTFTPTEIPWHTDFTTQTPSPQQWATAFYTDITIPSNTNVDIKIPWELSRLHHLVNCMNPKLFTDTIDAWMLHNRFLTGVNWFNPMEVAIRAINLIWASIQFRHTALINDSWWQKFDGILYSHLVYLEHNWEASDRPNNHFIADLLGLAYLKCYFNLDIKKTYQTLLKAITQQLLPDGTSYEGSTAYHRLVTEMVKHTMLLCRYFYGSVPEQLMQQYSMMQTFLDDCTDEAGNLVLIGDNDGGSLLGSDLGAYTKSFETRFEESLLRTSAPLYPAHPEEPVRASRRAIKTPHKIITYPSFGLTIIKHAGWHITFRSPTYSPHQPTGHFHQDWLAFTVSIDGMQIFIDPGTFVYTSSTEERNRLRSITSHNTFWTHFSSDLSHPFVLPRTPHEPTLVMTETEDSITLYDYHNEFSAHGLTAHRKLIFEKNRQELTITDWWTGNVHKILTHWAFHGGSDKQTYVFETQQKLITHESAFCPDYGKKIATHQLTRSMELAPEEKITHNLRRI